MGGHAHGRARMVIPCDARRRPMALNDQNESAKAAPMVQDGRAKAAPMPSAKAAPLPSAKAALLPSAKDAPMLSARAAQASGDQDESAGAAPTLGG